MAVGILIWIIPSPDVAAAVKSGAGKTNRVDVGERVTVGVKEVAGSSIIPAPASASAVKSGVGKTIQVAVGERVIVGVKDTLITGVAVGVGVVWDCTKGFIPGFACWLASKPLIGGLPVMVAVDTMNNASTETHNKHIINLYTLILHEK
ncbi:MAG: hypothetical protein AAF639_01605 [Chloroflexota bacterium]